MVDTPRATISVAGILHYLDLLQQIGSQAAKVSIKLEEIVPLDDPNLQAPIVPAQPEAQHREILFYKREGKYMVLLGRETLKRLMDSGTFNINGRLISGPMLKRTRCEVVNAVQAAVDAPQAYVDRPKHYPSDYRNAPRMTRSFSNGQERSASRYAK
jgi:hypothetical protein